MACLSLCFQGNLGEDALAVKQSIDWIVVRVDAEDQLGRAQEGKGLNLLRCLQ